MVDYFIYAKDCSDTINGAEYYQSNCLIALEQFKRDVESAKEQNVTQNPVRQMKIIYLNWGDICWEVNEDKVGNNNYPSDVATETKNSHICERRDPVCLIRHIRENYITNDNSNRIKLLYIITNGTITRQSIDECLKLNKDIDYEAVVLHTFNEDLDKIDMSVAAPFFKRRCVVYRNNVLCDTIDISKEFNYDNINSDNFAHEMQQLKSYIKLKYINTFEINTDVSREIKILDNLRNRMLTDLSENTPKCPYFDKMGDKERKTLMRTFDMNEFANYISMAYVMKTDVEEYVADMVHYIEDKKKTCSFDYLKFAEKVETEQHDVCMYDGDSSDDEESKLIQLDNGEICLQLN